METQIEKKFLCFIIYGISSLRIKIRCNDVHGNDKMKVYFILLNLKRI